MGCSHWSCKDLLANMVQSLLTVTLYCLPVIQVFAMIIAILYTFLDYFNSKGQIYFANMTFYVTSCLNSLNIINWYQVFLNVVDGGLKIRVIVIIVKT